MQSAHISDVILLSNDQALNKSFFDFLKSKGATNISIQDDADSCRDAMKRFPRALLIVDWDVGQKVIVPVLAANQAAPSGPLRPIFLIASQVTDELVATAAEYGVAQIYTDVKSVQGIGPRLTALAMSEALADEVRDALAQASEWRHGGDTKRALGVLLNILKKHPQNLRLKASVADLHIAMESPEDALKVLDGIERLTPPYLRGLHLRGRAHMRLGQFPEALALMEKASTLNPHDTNRLVEIGQTYLQLDNPAKAEENFDQALSVDPQVRAAKIGKSQCRLMEGDINEALTLLKDVSGDMEKASIFNTCAVINVRQGRHEDAVKLYQAAIKATVRSTAVQARIFFNLGLAHRRRGDKDQARQSFEKSISLDPTFIKARTHLAALTGTPSTPPQVAAPSGSSAGNLVKKPSSPIQPKTLESVFAPISTDTAKELDSLLEEDLEDSSFVAS
jgi:tetratricopeptide (TPR) repeat protein